MKKSLRVISLVLAIVMIAGSMSVLGYCYSDFRTQDGSGLTFDDVNTPVYTTEQYASMALDELDRMLNKAQLSVDIYIGTLDLMSVNGTVASVNELVGPNGSVKNLLNLGILGDASLLDVSAIASTSRSNGDTQVLWDLLDLIGGLFPILYKYVSGNVSLGALDGFIANYKFNIRELAIGMLYQLSGLGNTTDSEGNTVEYSYMDSRTVPSKYTDSNGILVLGQDVLNSLVLGEWKQLDDLFYNETTNKSSNVCYDEIVFYDLNSDGSLGNAVTGDLDTANYDYYGWVHPDRWVTSGLGDFIRVPSGTTAPAASYTKVNITNLGSVYDFVEPLLQYAANSIGVPVLNRLVKNWLREKQGYVFDEKYTELYTCDLSQYDSWTEEEKKANRSLYTEDGEAVINPDYDYLYAGALPSDGSAKSADLIFDIFDADNFSIPRLEVPSGHTFVEWFNRNAVIVLKNVISAQTIVHYGSDGSVKAADAKNNDVALSDGDYYTFHWVNKTNSDISYDFTATYGDNSLLMNNICGVLKFIIKATDTEFFSGILQNKGQVKSATDIDAMSNQQLLAYVVRSVINANVDYIWIDDDKDTLIDVCYDAVVQLAYQDLPQFTYTLPTNATTQDKVEKALAILMDIGAYNINAALDANLDTTATDSSYDPNNATGLVPYLGNTGSYGTSVAIIAAWAVSKWANTSYGNILSGINFNLDDNDGKTTGTTTITEDTFWNDLDNLVNAIIPIKTVAGASTSKPDNRPWISADIAGETQVVKSFLFDYVIYPILNLDINPILKILDKNANGAFSSSTIENVVVDLVHRVLDILFPDCFSNDVNTLDTLLNNTTLASMVKDVAVTLSATLTTGTVSGYTKVKDYSEKGIPVATTNGGTITGKGKILVEFALPIVCMILGLSDTQEFGELENYVPSVVSASDSSTIFQIYNGSSGVNTSYRDPDDYARNTDHLYTYELTAGTTSSVNSNSTVSTIGWSGVSLAAGKSANITISGYNAGDMLEITFKYKVKGEDGTYLNNGTELSSVTYVYVGTTDKGDDETLVKTAIGGQEIQYTTDYYLTDGLSSLQNYAFRIKDANSDETKTAVNVTSVTVTGPNAYTATGRAAMSWVGLSDNEDITQQTLSGQGGTYVFTPFAVEDDAYRVQYEYEKDDDGNTVKEDGVAVRESMKTPEGTEYYVADGLYTVTTTFSVGGSTGTISTRVHVYDDFGLDSLTNNAIAANRSAETLNTAGQNMLASYKTAIINAAVLSLAPHTNGLTFDSDIGSTTCLNKYEEYYKALYAAIEAIKPNELSSGAQAIWDAVNNACPYNYTRTSRSIGGTTVWFQNWKDYDASGYNYMGMRDYVGVTYRSFKSAVNDANSLISREFKYIGYSEEEWDKLSETTEGQEKQTAALTAYRAALENTEAISSVESAMAIHKVQLTHDRLIAFEAASNDKLQSVSDTYGTVDAQGTYTTTSYETYAAAKAFAETTLANTSASREQMAEAIEQLLGAWKRLENGADYSALVAAIAAAKQNVMNYEGGIGLAGMKVTGAVVIEQAEDAAYWTADSFAAYLTAIDAGDQLINDKNDGNELGTSDQDIIDDAVTAIATAAAALEVQGSGGEDPDEPTEEATFSLKTAEDFAEEFGDDFMGYSTSSGGIGVCCYYPTLNETDVSNTLGTVEDESSEYYEEDVDAVLYGVPEYFSDSDIQDLFNFEGCTVTVTQTEAGYGTGSYVIITDSASGEVLAIYVIAFRGDVNGDGTITSEDSTAIDCFTNYVDDYDWWSYDTYYICGGDATGDGAADAVDVALIDTYIAYMVDIDQAVGGEVAE